MRKQSKHNAWSRDNAVLYVNGEVLVGSDHFSLLEEYLVEKNKMEDFCRDFLDKNPTVLDSYDSEKEVDEDIASAVKFGWIPRKIAKELDDIDRSYGFNTSYAIAFAHESKYNIYIETDSLLNCNIDAVVSAISSKFPGYGIYDDDSASINSDDEKDYNRISASIIGIDNYMVIADDVYYGDTQFEAFENYVLEHSLKKFNNDFVNVFKNDLDRSEESLQNLAKKYTNMELVIDDVENFIYDPRIAMGVPMFFALESNNSIYIDTEHMYNISLNDAIAKTEAAFPNTPVFDDATGDQLNEVELVACKRRRLKAKHGIETRDTAILFINGQVMEGRTHPELVEQYLDNNNMDYIVKEFLNNSNRSAEDIEHAMQDYLKTKEIPYDMYRSITEYERGNGSLDSLKLPIAFAHRIDDEIYIEPDTMCDTTMNEVVSKIKEKYNNCKIFNDNSNELLAKKEAMHGVGNRDSAIIYIDGDILEGKVHTTLLRDYLVSHGMLREINKQFLDAQGIDEQDYIEELDYADEQKELVDDFEYAISEFGRDSYILEDYVDLPIAFAHRVGDEIYVMEDFLCNVNLREVVDALKSRYPEFDVYSDEEDIKIASTYSDISITDDSIVNEHVSNAVLAYKKNNNIYIYSDDVKDMQSVVSRLKKQYPECGIFDYCERQKNLASCRRLKKHTTIDCL